MKDKNNIYFTKINTQKCVSIPSSSNISNTHLYLNVSQNTLVVFPFPLLRDGIKNGKIHI